MAHHVDARALAKVLASARACEDAEWPVTIDPEQPAQGVCAKMQAGVRPEETGIDPLKAAGGRMRVIASDAYGDFEFFDASRRGPERREFAVALGRF
ncbi:hypothetical protein ACIOJE_40790 [Kitasatospora sp. NPDC087861]|uniref:hypothetical protein n=1 Tax=Kitasatospora sp. NPDC087861 TaxID=3364070 RepID=UPI0037FE186A